MTGFNPQIGLGDGALVPLCLCKGADSGLGLGLRLGLVMVRPQLLFSPSHTRIGPQECPLSSLTVRVRIELRATAGARARVRVKVRDRVQIARSEVDHTSRVEHR